MVIENQIYHLTGGDGRGTIGVIKKTGNPFCTVICLNFPYFRYVPLSELETLSPLSENIDELVIYASVGKGSDAPPKSISSKRWDAILAEYRKASIELICDEWDKEDVDFLDAEFVKNVRKIIAEELIDSEWLVESVYHEQIIKLSYNYLDVTNDKIRFYLKTPLAESDWKTLLKATATAYFVEDVYVAVKERFEAKRRMSER